MRVIRGGSELPSHDATGFVEQPLAVLRASHVAALNLSPEPGDVKGNLRLAERAATEAKRAHPDLAWVVLPELFTTAYSDLASVHRYAESAEWGPSARFFAALAREVTRAGQPVVSRADDYDVVSRRHRPTSEEQALCQPHLISRKPREPLALPDRRS